MQMNSDVGAGSERARNIGKNRAGRALSPTIWLIDFYICGVCGPSPIVLSPETLDPFCWAQKDARQTIIGIPICLVFFRYLPPFVAEVMTLIGW